ncbi:hypothetical protein F4806DRAFT_159869 [Annulohypoxylon nitens]|nr:hypothetical protein F4806DRAFT_159869 [Annulohypoxylon nitens]
MTLNLYTFMVTYVYLSLSVTLHTMEMSQLQSDLLTALEDFCQVAKVLIKHKQQIASESRIFHSDLWGECWQLREQIVKVARLGLGSLLMLLSGILVRLESLIVPAPAHPQFYRRQRETEIRYPGLEILHLLLKTCFRDQSIMIIYLRNRINFGTKHNQDGLIAFLKNQNNCLKTQTLNYITKDIDLLVPLHKSPQEPPVGIWPQAKLLFWALESRKRCTCNSTHEYVMQLCLETHRAKLIDYDFDLYLVLGREWQETRVQAATSSRLHVVVNEKKRKVEQLCTDIQQVHGSFPGHRLRLHLEKDILWKLSSEKSNVRIDETKPTISLAQIIIEKSSFLTEKTKRVLCVLLAYAVYHLHGTPWLESPWSSSNVMFLWSSNGVPMRPYIEKRPNNSHYGDVDSRTAIDEQDDDPDSLLLPSYPCLIDLAVILMEIYEAKPLELLARKYSIPVVKDMNTSARYILVKDVFEQCQFVITDRTRMAIDSCLDPNIGLDDNKEKLDENGLQAVIYQRIVRELEDELEHAFSSLSVDKLDELVQKMDLTDGGRLMSTEGGRNSTSYTLRPFPTIDNKAPNRHDSSVVPGQGKLFVEKTSRPHPDKVYHFIDILNMKQPLVTTTQELPVVRPRNIRVRDIPDEKSEGQLATELGNLFSSECKIHSLARVSRNPAWLKCATVTFPTISDQDLNNLIEKKECRGPSNFLYDTEFLWTTPLYDAGERAAFDIIAIEGLGTNPFGTFRSPQSDDMWLRDYLPEKFKSCRILLYGYDSKVADSKTNQSVQEIAATCKNDLLEFRELTKTEKRQVIWIGQSMGGLIVQEPVDSPQNLWTSSIGFLSFGVPSNGLKNESLLEYVRGKPNFELVNSISTKDGKPSDYLEKLAYRFSRCKNRKLRIHDFLESNPSYDQSPGPESATC